ncbi:MAG: DNA topoisomerase IV [Arenibacter sp.]|uniref:DNA topoisomerase IV n=1 Tax=Arenibacter TaxID=178469 RepID=UPI000A36A619|nr:MULTISPECIES: DNA topoisomerase IV [Arenibacter]MDX1326624.1 DNA topoisomerase IV [Arenibacter sp.]
MIKRIPLVLVALLSLSACYQPERNCADFKDGKFSFTATIDGEEHTTIFERRGDIEIEHFGGKSDTSSVRWINPCEYVVRKLHPKNMAEEKSIHMKILSTTKDSYTFEYRLVGSPNRSTGTAIKVD